MQRADQPHRGHQGLWKAIDTSSSAVTLSRRRLALIAVAAVAALGLGFLAAKVFGPGHSRGAGAPTATTPTATSPTATAPVTPPAATATAATPAPTPATPAVPAPTPTPTSPAAGQTLPTALPTVAVTDARAGFRIAYPRAWTRLTSKDPSVSLLLASRGDGVSLLVRAVKLTQPINGPRLAVLRDETGRLIRARPGVQVVAGPRLLQTANLPGFLYIYTFPDPISKERVGHSQITLYAGRRMYTLVFQTARATDLPRFAMLFDKITASFGAT